MHDLASKTTMTQENLNNNLCIVVSMRQIIKLLLIITILASVAPHSAYAYSQFEGSTSGIVLETHLIEMGYDTSGDTVSVVSRETLVFKSYGDSYTGALNAWIPDGSSNIFVFKSSHQIEGKELLKHAQNENIITWDANIVQDVATMYSVEYTTDLESGFGGSLGLIRMINHDALPYPTSTFKLAISGDDEVTFKGINGKTIVPDNAYTEGDNRVFSWESEGGVLELSGVNILRRGNEGAGSTEYYMFAILGIVALIVILYPFINGKFKDRKKERTHK